MHPVDKMDLLATYSGFVKRVTQALAGLEAAGIVILLWMKV